MKTITTLAALALTLSLAACSTSKQSPGPVETDTATGVVCAKYIHVEPLGAKPSAKPATPAPRQQACVATH